MTVPTDQSFVILQGNGVTTVWPYSFRITDPSQVFVEIKTPTGNTVLDASQYYITGVDPDNYNGGQVTYPITGYPLPAGSSIVIARNAAYTQLLDLVNQSGFYPDTIELALDLIMFNIQQLAAQVAQAVRGDEYNTGSMSALGDATARANKLLAFDSNGQPTLVDLTVTGSVEMAALLAGQLPILWPDIADGAAKPAAGSRLPYLSGGVPEVAK